jgi:hypothetical protein
MRGKNLEKKLETARGSEECTRNWPSPPPAAFGPPQLRLTTLLDLARSGVVPNIPIQRRQLSEATEALEDLKAGRVVGRVVLLP